MLGNSNVTVIRVQIIVSGGSSRHQSQAGSDGGTVSAPVVQYIQLQMPANAQYVLMNNTDGGERQSGGGEAAGPHLQADQNDDNRGDEAVHGKK